MHCKALRLSRGRRGVDEELLRASAAVADLRKRKKVRFDIKRDLNPVFQSKLRHLVADDANPATGGGRGDRGQLKVGEKDKQRGRREGDRTRENEECRSCGMRVG